MTESESVKIEIENDNAPEFEEQTTSASLQESSEVPAIKTVVPQKKVSELSEDEKNILIDEAKQGIENEFYKVKLFKNGNAHITQKKLTKSQKFIKANETNQDKVEIPKVKFLTNDQLLMEHIINLEASFQKLKGKHKKLKKRYNELEGYLLNDDSDDDDSCRGIPAAAASHEVSSQLTSQKFQHEVPRTNPQPLTESIQPQSIQSIQPQVQFRYHRSWRDIRPQQ